MNKELRMHNQQELTLKEWHMAYGIMKNVRYHGEYRHKNNETDYKRRDKVQNVQQDI